MNFIIHYASLDNLPQLNPIFFIDQVTFVFIIIIFSNYIIANYLLPKNTSLSYYRLFILK